MKLSYSVSGISDKVLYNPFVSEVELLPPVGKSAIAESEFRAILDDGEEYRTIIEADRPESRNSVLFGFLFALTVLSLLGGSIASQASQVSRGIVRAVPTEYQKVAREFQFGGW